MILAIETTTKVCSVALFKDGKLLGFRESDDAEYDHAEKLNPFIEELLKEQQISPKDLKAVAVSEGPGSYTGLRIGVSSAKGLCYAVGIPLITVSPFQAMLSMSGVDIDSGKKLFPMLDARRREVFAQSFSRDRVDKVEAIIFEEDDTRFSDASLHFMGPGADKFAEEFKAANYIPNIYPSAKHMGHIAQVKFNAEEFADLAYFEPFYLKDFKAIKAKSRFNRR